MFCDCILSQFSFIVNHFLSNSFNFFHFFPFSFKFFQNIFHFPSNIRLFFPSFRTSFHFLYTIMSRKLEGDFSPYKKQHISCQEMHCFLYFLLILLFSFYHIHKMPTDPPQNLNSSSALLPDFQHIQKHIFRYVLFFLVSLPF